MVKIYNIFFNSESKDASYVSKFSDGAEYRLMLTSPGVLSIASDNLGEIITAVQGYGNGIANIAVGANVSTALDIVTIAPEPVAKPAAETEPVVEPAPEVAQNGIAEA